MIKGAFILLVYLTGLMALLFIPAGRIDWPMGWASMGAYTLISVMNLLLADRTLVVERTALGSGACKRDVLVAVLSFAFFLPCTLVVAGLDFGRFNWSPRYPIWIKILALAVFAAAYSVGSWAMIANRYFSTFLRIQSDRGHVLVTEGPYRYVRHPGYAGTIVASIALPVALGSLWGLVPAFAGALGFVVRTKWEDNILLEKLEGYAAYAGTVRYRLIPGIW